MASRLYSSFFNCSSNSTGPCIYSSRTASFAQIQIKCRYRKMKKGKRGGGDKTNACPWKKLVLLSSVASRPVYQCPQTLSSLFDFLSAAFSFLSFWTAPCPTQNKDFILSLCVCGERWNTRILFQLSSLFILIPTHPICPSHVSLCAYPRMIPV